MKKSSILLSALLVYSTITFSQISIGIKAPKLKNKEEKKTETTNTQVTNTSKETVAEPVKETKAVEVKKEEPMYYSTNYSPSKEGINCEKFVKVAKFEQTSDEYIKFYYNVSGTYGLSSEGGDYYKNGENAYVQSPRKSMYLFKQENGSFIMASNGGNCVNLFSTNAEHITNAPSVDVLVQKAKEGIETIKMSEMLKDIAKNDDEFKKNVNQTSKNATLENQIKTALTKSEVNLKPEFKNVYKKVILNSADWFVVNDAYGKPAKKVYNITYIATDSKNKCFYGMGSVMKEHLGGGKYSDAIKFNAGIPFANGTYKKYISCELVN